MTNRREFLQIGLAASTLGTLTPPLAGASGIPERSVLPLYKVIYDRRRADSERFARKLASLLPDSGEPTDRLHGITGDITPFWYTELDAVWRREPVALAGMTAQGPLFCLERLGWEKGLRVVWRSEHRPEPEGLITHEMEGPKALLDLARSGTLALAGKDRDWCESVAAIMAQCHPGLAQISRQTLMAPLAAIPANPAGATGAAEPLVSWIIAPARYA